MSQDWQLAHACPHLTVEEPVTLDSDSRSLQTLQPCASAAHVRLLANDTFYIPQVGLLSTAQIEGATSGPFNIIANENVLTVTGSGETVTVSLSTGTRITADTVVSELAPVLTDLTVENVNGHLVFTDAAVAGPESRIKVTGTAAPALGFGDAYGARGRVVFPPWGLVLREDTITNRHPRFASPVRQRATFKATYTVPPHRCRRCRATYVENDARFNRQGDAVIVEGENLLYQAALKILLTEIRSNPYHRWYGTSLMSRIGTKAISGTATLINEDVTRALDSMQKMQTQQVRFQRVTPEERLYSINSVDVRRHTQDPTAYMVDVVVSNASMRAIRLSVVFTVPGAVALMGSNGMSLGLGPNTAANKSLRRPILNPPPR